MTVGENIKKGRLLLGMTQKDLADLIFVSTSTVQKWEVNKNQVPPEKIRLLASILQIDISDLIPEDNKIPNNDQKQNSNKYYLNKEDYIKLNNFIKQDSSLLTKTEKLYQNSIKYLFLLNLITIKEENELNLERE